jgi:hypothetical protein
VLKRIAAWPRRGRRRFRGSIEGAATQVVKEVWAPLNEIQWAPHIAALAAAQPDVSITTIMSDDEMRFIETAGINFFKRFPCCMLYSLHELVRSGDKIPRFIMVTGGRGLFFAHLDSETRTAPISKIERTSPESNLKAF